MNGSRAPVSVEPAIGRRLVLIKQVFQNASALSSDITEVSKILAVLQLDFTVETLLKTIVSLLGLSTRYMGEQGGYTYSISRLQSDRYNPKADFPRVFDKVVAYRDPEKGISREGPH